MRIVAAYRRTHGPSHLAWSDDWELGVYRVWNRVNPRNGNTIRPIGAYDTRCYFNVRSKADMSQLNLPHETDD